MGANIKKQKSLKGFLPKVDSWLSWAVERIGLNTAVFYHLAITVILFSPFLMFGKPLIASTDNIIHMFPNFLFSHRAFNNGELGLWNPYIYCGINFSGSPQNFIYYPINWLLIFPEKFVYLLMTCRMFFETWFVGVFAFLFFREELKDTKWALFTSTVYQLCGYMFFSTTAYAGLTIYTLMTFAIYLIYTLHKRRECLSFLGIASCVAGIFLCNNPLYGLATLFSLGILMVYRYFSFNFKQPSRWKDLRLLVLSYTTGMLINMIYLLPFMHSLLTVGTKVGSKHLDTLRGSIYFGLTAFVPEVMAISYKTSFPWLQTLLGRMDMHSQNHAFTYFGGLSIILLLWAVLSMHKLKIGFWLSYLFLASCWYLRISPVSDVLNILFFPLIHEIVPMMMIPLPFCVIVGHAAKQLGENPESGDKESLRTVTILIIISVLSMLAFFALSHSQFIKTIQLVSRVIILLSFGTVLIFVYKKKAMKVCLPFIPMIGAVGSVFVIFSTLSGAGNSLNNLGIVYAAISVLGISVLWFFVEMFCAEKYSKKIFLYMFLAVSVVLVLAWLHMQKSLLPQLAQPGFSTLFFFGLLRFAFVVAFFIVLLGKAQAGLLNKKYLYLCLLGMILVDLIPYNKVYSHMVMAPFTKEDFYPNQKKFITDRGLKHYRVNVPNVYVERLPEPRYYSNAPIVYGIRSFGGVNADVPQRHQHFSDTLHPAPGEKLDFFKHQRFLELNGTHYDITIKGERFTRPEALSRFMLYKNFDIIKDDAGTIKRLYDPEFPPLKKVVLNKSPGILQRPSDELAERLEYTEIKTSVLECKVKTDGAALVYFGDSYHKDWKAFVNGKEVPVIRANYKFMATVVPAGESKVVFQFQPQMFLVGKNLTLIGLFLLVLFSIFGIMRD